MAADYKHRRIGGRKGKMRLAHHIIWETIKGPIPENYEIHHIDENKQNNDIENLICVSVSDHQRIHSPYYAVMPDGTWTRVCPDCRRVHLCLRPICDPCRARRARIERRQKRSQKSTTI